MLGVSEDHYPEIWLFARVPLAHYLTRTMPHLQGQAINGLVPQQAWVDAETVISIDMVFKVLCLKCRISICSDLIRMPLADFHADTVLVSDSRQVHHYRSCFAGI